MLCTGYKLNGYNATYRKATFEVKEKNRVLEITEPDSGITFIVDMNEEKPKKNRHRIDARKR